MNWAASLMGELELTWLNPRCHRLSIYKKEGYDYVVLILFYCFVLKSHWVLTKSYFDLLGQSNYIKSIFIRIDLKPKSGKDTDLIIFILTRWFKISLVELSKSLIWQRVGNVLFLYFLIRIHRIYHDINF